MTSNPTEIIRIELLKEARGDFDCDSTYRKSPGGFYEWLKRSKYDLTALEMCEAVRDLETDDNGLPTPKVLCLIGLLLASRESRSIFADSAYRWLPSVVKQLNPSAEIWAPIQREGEDDLHWSDSAFPGTYNIAKPGNSLKYDTVAIIPYTDYGDWAIAYSGSGLECQTMHNHYFDTILPLCDQLSDDGMLIYLDCAETAVGHSVPKHFGRSMPKWGLNMQAVFECGMKSQLRGVGRSRSWLYTYEKKPSPQSIPVYRVDPTVQDDLEDLCNPDIQSLRAIVEQYRRGIAVHNFRTEVCPGIELIDIQRQISNQARVLAVPMVPISEFFRVPEDGEVPNGYVEIDSRIVHSKMCVNTALANPEFVRIFSQSELGLAYLKSLSSEDIQWGSRLKILLSDAWPLPPLQRQAELIKASRVIQEARSQVVCMEHALWNERDGLVSISPVLSPLSKEGLLRGWIESLPSPLAYLLVDYFGDVVTLKQKCWDLLCFLETLCQYIATISMSALKPHDSLWKEFASKVAGETGYQLPGETSFGTWKKLAFSSGRIIRDELPRVSGTPIDRKTIGTTTFTTERNHLMWARICSKRLCSVFDRANEARNRWKGHGPNRVSDTIVSELHDSLFAMVEEVREVLGYSLGQLNLVIPGSGTMTRHGFECRLQCLSGTKSPATEYTTRLNHPPVAGQLYLDPQTNAELIPVLPFVFAELGLKPIFYFYSRKNGSKYLFVSHNCELAPERELTSDADVHLLEIFDRLVSKGDLE